MPPASSPACSSALHRRRARRASARALVGLLAHHDAADRGVADHEPGVDAEPALDLVEVLGGRRPVPRHALAERLERHALDPRQHAHEVVAVGGVVGQRRDGEAAVAGERGGDAVQRRRRERAVPEHLRVEVGVHVDEPGRDDLAGGVDGLGGLVVDLADARRCVAVGDARRRPGGGRPGAVDDVATLDDDVQHGVAPLFSDLPTRLIRFTRSRLVAICNVSLPFRNLLPARSSSQGLELARLDAEVTLEVAVQVDDPALLARQRRGA